MLGVGQLDSRVNKMNGRPCTIVTRDDRVREPRTGAAWWKGKSPKKNNKPSPYQRAMATGRRHTSCLTSWLQYAGVGIMGGRFGSLSPRQRPLVRRIPTALR
jgi:hypothetical protein